MERNTLALVFNRFYETGEIIQQKASSGVYELSKILLNLRDLKTILPQNPKIQTSKPTLKKRLYTNEYLLINLNHYAAIHLLKTSP